MKWTNLTAALFAALSFATAAYAEEVRIGYVDMRKVMTENKAGKRVKDELEKMIKERRESLEREQQQLKNMEQAFEKDRLLLSDAKKQERRREFEERLKAFQQAAQKAEREVEQKQTEYERKVSPEIRGIIRELAKEEKLTLVFEKSSMPVLYAAEGPDLTARIIQRLDAKGGS